jgi:hypothetical protein
MCLCVRADALVSARTQVRLRGLTYASVRTHSLPPSPPLPLPSPTPPLSYPVRTQFVVCTDAGKIKIKNKYFFIFIFWFFLVFFGSCWQLEKKLKNFVFGFWFSIPKIPELPELRGLHGQSCKKKKVFSA